MNKHKEISPVMEDYLEVIAALQEKNKVVRVRDISTVLNVKSPTVNSALKSLSKEGLVVHERYGYVELTSKGRQMAVKIQHRHNTLLKFLTKILYLDKNTASKDACKMEHAISPKTFSRLTQFVEFLENRPAKANCEWLKSFKTYLNS